MDPEPTNPPAPDPEHEHPCRGCGDAIIDIGPDDLHDVSDLVAYQLEKHLGRGIDAGEYHEACCPLCLTKLTVEDLQEIHTAGGEL